jgi:hypothetical protein
MIFREGRQRPRRPRGCVPRPLIAEARGRDPRTARERSESCDELSTRMQGNHRLVGHPEDGSATLSSCLCQRGLRKSAVHPTRSNRARGLRHKVATFGVRPSYDDELGAVEAFGLNPGASWRRTGLSATRLGCLLACGERHAGNSGGLTVRDWLTQREERGLRKCGADARAVSNQPARYTSDGISVICASLSDRSVG